MSERETLLASYGWSIEESVSSTGKPRLTLSKPERPTITIDRAARTPVDVALERVAVTAIEQDLFASSPDDRALWQQRLREAMRERDDAAAQRAEAAGAATDDPSRSSFSGAGQPLREPKE